MTVVILYLYICNKYFFVICKSSYYNLIIRKLCLELLTKLLTKYLFTCSINLYDTKGKKQEWQRYKYIRYRNEELIAECKRLRSDSMSTLKVKKIQRKVLNSDPTPEKNFGFLF